MKKSYQLLLAGLLLMAVTACTSYVDLNNTTFYEPGFKPGGTIYVAAANKKEDDSLEFAHYKSKIETFLRQNGYTISENPKMAQSVAIVSYGIDNGRVSTQVRPIYGYVGGGYYDLVYPGYAMPSYTVVGVTSVERTTYKRAVALDIVDGKSLRDGKAKQIYSARAVSNGSCPTINQVMDELLTGMFSDFPGKSGETKFIQVEGKIDCKTGNNS
ncbi:Uncharacterised protein [BD1-7 clade bacterium]|uniref:DUF4136 domain-containing protein n=1 Tax=BD1-7 clade bacterium TaxID=2029982 RepID=A0A5S9MUT6_9GAMM|nr:Uncharacterised protein [BD1-7 clade bacterium]